MQNKYGVYAIVIAAVAVVIAAVALVSAMNTNNSSFGGASNFDRIIEDMSVVASSTTGTTGTLTVAQIRDNGILSYTPNTSAVTLLLPASTTFSDFLPNVGDVTTFIIKNATGTAAATITVASSTGTILSSASTTAANIQIGAGEYGVLTLVRDLNSDIHALLQPYR